MRLRPSDCWCSTQQPQCGWWTKTMVLFYARLPGGKTSRFPKKTHFKHVPLLLDFLKAFPIGEFLCRYFAVDKTISYCSFYSSWAFLLLESKAPQIMHMGIPQVAYPSWAYDFLASSTKRVSLSVNFKVWLSIFSIDQLWATSMYALISAFLTINWHPISVIQCLNCTNACALNFELFHWLRNNWL